MTRKKVTLAYITNDSERKASFKKRKKGLIKKVSELATLCGVDACAIIYSPYDAVPEVWPSLLGAQAVLARFRKMSSMDQSRKMVNQESFTRQRIKKSEDQLLRLQKENKRREMECFIFHGIAGRVTIDDFNLRHAAEMGWVLNQTLSDIKAKMEELKRNQQLQQVVYPPPPLPQLQSQPPPPAAAETAPGFQAVEEQVVPGMGMDDLEGFPWNLVQSPTGAGGGGLDDGGLGWDDGMVLPYPYIFNHFDNSDNPGNGGN